MPTCFSDPPATGDCRSRLVQAACAVFAAEGYRVGVDRIAAQAGVAKQTLYNHFSSKADLFAEVIRTATAEFLVALDDESEGLRERLLRFGTGYRERLLSPGGLSFYRMLVAEIPRFPELAAAFYESGPRRTAQRLRAVLAEAMQRGALRRDDADFAASMLLSMLVGAERSHCMFSGEPPPPADPAVAARLVDCFLRAFAPDDSGAAASSRRKK